MKRYPQRGHVYSLAQILNELELRDSPSLGFEWGSAHSCVQNAHLTDAQLLSVPGIEDVRWRYIRETFEWIPVFECVNPAVLWTCLDISREWDGLMQREAIWATPKGFPRAWWWGAS